jgi:glycosyltransferase involved in cell wall biosynthesis
MSRRVLLVSYFFPPCPDTGAHRPAAMAKYLRGDGHDVTVLTTRAYGDLPDDEELGVVRTADLQLARARLRGRDSVEPIFGAAGYTGKPHPLSHVLVPEPLVAAWIPFARSKALRMHRRDPFDCVITTSPPESAHMIGRALQHRGAGWIADLRDGWNFEPLRPRLIGPLRRADASMERRLLGAADVVTCVTEATAEDARNRLAARAAVVPSGFEPAPDGTSPTGLLDPDRVSVVYTGRFGHYSRDPSFLLDALADLASADPKLAAKLELVFAGPYRPQERELLERSVEPARIKVLDALSREEALALQREADALLLIASSKAGTGAAFESGEPAGVPRPGAGSAKLFEYLGAGPPILALAAETEAGRIVEEAGAGVVVGAADTEAIKDALRKLAAGKVRPASDAGRAPYAYPRIAERMSEQIERAIARRP